MASLGELVTLAAGSGGRQPNSRPAKCSTVPLESTMWPRNSQGRIRRGPLALCERLRRSRLQLQSQLPSHLRSWSSSFRTSLVKISCGSSCGAFQLGELRGIHAMVCAGKIKQEQEVVVITGCSEGGIGHALADAFAGAGYRVIATARSLTSMKPLEQNDKIELLELDVTAEPEVIQGAIDGVMARFGRLDVLVNNAGAHCIGPLAVVPVGTLESCYRTNVFGPLALVQAVVPHMVAQRKGKIVNVGSIGGLCATPWVGAYASSKAALHSMTDALRLELRPFGIDVIVVVPGAITSNMGKQARKSKESLPGLKMFQPFEPAIERRWITQTCRSTPREELARKTLEAVRKKSSPRYLVYGRSSSLYAWLYHAPIWIRDLVLSELAGLQDEQILDRVKKQV